MFYAVDADEIGKRIEYLLLSDAAKEAALFSQSVSESVDLVRGYFERRGAQVIFAAGDSLLAFSQAPLDLNAALPAKGDITWSVGIGETPSMATLALKKAKGLGRNRKERFTNE